MKLFFILYIVIQSIEIGTVMSDTYPDLIVINGKIITVDSNFSICDAIAVKDGRFMAVGSNDEIINLASDRTVRIDLKGKSVLPGLIDAHLHPESASLSELEDTIPDVHSLDELLNWIKNQAAIKSKGEWIIHHKFFPTRLREMRQPSLEELDKVAPNNPVFLNGSYGGMINSAAMRVSNITKAMNNPAILKISETGELSGFIQASAFSLLKMDPRMEITYEEQLDALEKMIKRYNSIGITSLCSGSGSPANMKKYIDLKMSGRLTARILQNINLPVKKDASVDEIRDKLLSLGYYSGFGDEWIRVGALKVWIDGGILTGTARLRDPWGNKAKAIYGITDMSYRGLLFMDKETLIKIGTVAIEIGWKMTAHCTGGGGVDVILDAYEEINRRLSIKPGRFSIIHGNFYSMDAIERMKNLGAYADMQPAWFFKDADAMNYVLGERRIKTFHPYKSLFNGGVIVNGGSDHMVKFDSYASINPYNPFLAMWSVITRETERGSYIVQEEAITREQALKMYTINNAYASFEENLKGSIEPGKLADLVVISEDFLTCPDLDIKNIMAEMTMVGGKIVYQR